MQFITKSHAASQIGKVISTVSTDKTLVLLSGGSSASVGVDALKLVSKNQIKNIIAMLADERYLPYGSDGSNAKLLKSFGIQNYCHQFIEVLFPENADINATTDLFRKNLAEQLAAVKNVIAVLGVGTNNHTTGIMPNSMSVNTNDLLAINFKYSDFERITITPAVFKNINYAFLYAEGADKEQAVQAIERDLDYSEYPSQLIKKCQHWQVMYNKEKL